MKKKRELERRLKLKHLIEFETLTYALKKNIL